MSGRPRSLDIAAIRNRLRGILGVATVWTVAPTNLERCTDGDYGVMTGVGNKAVGTYAEAGRIDFDMGAVYNVVVRGKARIGNTFAGGDYMPFELFGSEDGITYFPCTGWEGDLSSPYCANSFQDFYFVAFLRGRYIQFQWHSLGNATTVSGAVYEIEAIDLGI